jgi:crotonobetainyl-CoA:carnitine CoA-transferase CaiB-like acyl-CoA transferase
MSDADDVREVLPAPGAARPLAGVRVLDLSRIIAGPLAAQYLADLGADVVKVERPGTGDDARGYVFPSTWRGESTMFLSFNRGKRSVVLDLDDAGDRAAIETLLGDADVLVENFRPGVMERLGLGWDALSARFPRLVMCSVSGFGADGPAAETGANDLVAQASCGLMALNAGDDGRPRKVAPAVVDLFTAANAALAIVAALRARDASGRGSRVTTSLFECGVALQSYFATGAFAERAAGRTPDMSAAASATVTVPNQAFRCRDGWIVVACSNDAMFARLATALDAPALAADARFATNAARTAHRDALVSRLDAAFAEGTREVWVARLGANKVSVSGVMKPEEALAHPQAAHLGMAATSPHARIDGLRTPAVPFSIDGVRPQAPIGPPLLGEHDAGLRARQASRSTRNAGESSE